MPRSPEQPNPVVNYDFYARPGHEALNEAEITECENVYERITALLPYELNPRKLKPEWEKEFTFTLHRTIHSMGIGILPVDDVHRAILAYYTYFPPDSIDPAVLQHKWDYQNRYIGLAQDTSQEQPAVTAVARFALACRAREFKTASKSAHGLLSAYGNVIEDILYPRGHTMYTP